MKYKSKELRNKNLALLRRLQRQMDKEEEPIIEEKIIKGFNKNIPKFNGSGKGIGANRGRGGCEVIRSKRKNVRLNLLDRRNMF